MSTLFHERENDEYNLFQFNITSIRKFVQQYFQFQLYCRK